MKKTGSKRGSGYDGGPGSAVLEAPEENYASERETRGRWPAPAGALQRGYGSEGYDEPGSGYGAADEPEYVPRRGNFKLRFRGLPRSIAGRIVLGVVAFCLLGAVAVAIAGVRYYLLHDPRFVVGTTDDIQINGAEHLTRGQVLSVFGADLERNIFRMSLAERRGDLERLPWVEHATVMRLLPNRIRVKITERTPVAFVRQGTQIGLVDAGGVLLDMPPDSAGDPHYSFPVLTGLSADLPLGTRAARMQIYEQFMAELGRADAHLTDSLSEVDVSDPEDVKALIASGSADILVHFGNEDFLKRYQEFEQHLPEWKQQYPKLASADMRYEGQIVLEMQGDKSGSTSVDASTDVPVALPVAEKAAAKPAALKSAAVKPVALKLVGADAVKPAAVNSLAGAAPKAAAAPVAVGLSGSAVKVPVGKPEAKKPAPAKRVEAKKVEAKKAAAKKAAARKAAAKNPAAKKMAAGKSAANEKVFAALAASHKAALAKAAAAKSGGARAAGGVTP